MDGEITTYDTLMGGGEVVERSPGELGKLIKEVVGNDTPALKEKFTFMNGVLTEKTSNVAPNLHVLVGPDPELAIISYGDEINSQIVIKKPSKSFVESHPNGTRSVVFARESVSRPGRITVRRLTAVTKG